MGSDEPIQVKGEIQKQLDRQIREMVSALTGRLTKLEHIDKTKPGSSQPNTVDGEDDDDTAVRVVTLAGSNTGATMRTGSDETSKPYYLPWGEQEMSAYVNSNFQAINNSLMLGGSYNCSDPGVHMNFIDYVHDDQLHHPHEELHKPKKKSGKKKKKGKNISSSSSSSSNDEDHHD